MTDNRFYNATHAFEVLFPFILQNGVEVGNGTKAIYNCGFYLINPKTRIIESPARKWSLTYAEREWEWYLSKDRSVAELKKYAPIWDRMHGGDDIVNSNYGFLWSEENQLEKTIELLKKDPTTRQAWITIYDGKNRDEFEFDTPCTIGLGFEIGIDGRLNMTVLMRSNDLFYGFCNDQYCFSKLQELIADRLEIEVGYYYHFAANMHIYEQHYNLIL